MLIRNFLCACPVKGLRNLLSLLNQNKKKWRETCNDDQHFISIYGQTLRFSQSDAIVTIYVALLLKCLTWRKETDPTWSALSGWGAGSGWGDRLLCLGGEVRVTPDALAIVSVSIIYVLKSWNCFLWFLCLADKYYFPAEEWPAAERNEGRKSEDIKYLGQTAGVFGKGASVRSSQKAQTHAHSEESYSWYLFAQQLGPSLLSLSPV